MIYYIISYVNVPFYELKNIIYVIYMSYFQD